MVLEEKYREESGVAILFFLGFKNMLSMELSYEISYRVGFLKNPIKLGNLSR